MTRVRSFSYSKIRFYLAWLCVLGLVGFVVRPSIAAGPGSFDFTPDPWGGSPAFIYGISQDGSLKWFRHNGSPKGQSFDVPDAWMGPQTVGSGWTEPKQVFAGGGNNVYAIFNDGTLRWYKHKGFSVGKFDWDGPKDVGRGWADAKQVFAGGEGVIYAVDNDGILKWFRHNRYRDGAGLDVQGSWDGPKTVGRGWGDLKQVFAGGEGVIYAITNDGTLKWFKHNGYKTGAGLDVSGSWEGPKLVGRGWGDSKQVFTRGDGIIYVIDNDGTLKWFKHNGYKTGAGLDVSGSWEGPKIVGRGWGDLEQVFALLPEPPPPVN